MYICCKLLLCKPMKLAPSTSHRFILGDSSTGEGKGITTREQVCLAVFRWPEGPSCFNVSVWQLVPNKTQQINHLTWQINHLRWAKIKIIFIYLVFYQIFWGVSVGHGFFCWVSNEFLTSCLGISRATSNHFGISQLWQIVSAKVRQFAWETHRVLSPWATSPRFHLDPPAPTSENGRWVIKGNW